MILRNKYITDIKKYFNKNLDEINYKTLTPNYNITFNDSEKKFLEEKIICSKIIKRNKDKGFTQREGFLCSFKNVKFFGQSGGLVYKNLTIVESAFNINRLKGLITSDSIILKHRKMKGVYTSIMHYFDGVNYYHWLLDNIPRLYGISKIEEQEIYFIVHKGISKLQLKSLRIFLDDRFKIIKIRDTEVWKLENFYFPSFCTDDCSGYMPKEYLEFVKNNIIQTYNIDTKKRNKRIYISREKAPKRRLKNEKQFFELLKKYNFIKVYAENLSFKKQVELFNSANNLISIHGAGLSNIIFSENLNVIEIQPPNAIETHYFMLSKALGFKYYYIIGYEQDENLNFKVDLLEAEKLIKRVVKE